jgi:hypothetical protein
MEGDFKTVFGEEMQRVEQSVMLNFKAAPPQAVVDCAYYFCKF